MISLQGLPAPISQLGCCMLHILECSLLQNELKRCRACRHPSASWGCWTRCTMWATRWSRSAPPSRRCRFVVCFIVLCVLRLLNASDLGCQVWRHSSLVLLQGRVLCSARPYALALPRRLGDRRGSQGCYQLHTSRIQLTVALCHCHAEAAGVEPAGCGCGPVAAAVQPAGALIPAYHCCRNAHQPAAGLI